ncbi:hypothetical protein V6N13_107710 [Hibiscus sabdariffa]
MDLGSVAPGFMMYSPNLDFIFAVRVAFVSATDSENSEDRSSESSTAASMPKMKNLSGNTLDNSSEGVQQGKGIVGSSKKARGVWVKIEKENSHSSMESDSRSSNFIFTHGLISVTSNEKQHRNFVNYDEK